MAALMTSHTKVNLFEESRRRTKYIKAGAQKVNPEMKRLEMIELSREENEEWKEMRLEKLGLELWTLKDEIFLTSREFKIFLFRPSFCLLTVDR